MEEQWKIIRYNNNYEVSNKGRVRNKIRGNILTPRIHSHGYLRVQLSGKDYYIHRLVAEHFITYRTLKPYINHIDGDKTNNNKENLEWCTQSYNLKHNYKLGISKPVKNYGEKNGNSKLKEGEVWLIRKIKKSINISNYKLAKMFKVSAPLIRNIINKQIWIHI